MQPIKSNSLNGQHFITRYITRGWLYAHRIVDVCWFLPNDGMATFWALLRAQEPLLCGLITQQSPKSLQPNLRCRPIGIWLPGGKLFYGLFVGVTRAIQEWSVLLALRRRDYCLWVDQVDQSRLEATICPTNLCRSWWFKEHIYKNIERYSSCLSIALRFIK